MPKYYSFVLSFFFLCNNKFFRRKTFFHPPPSPPPLSLSLWLWLFHARQCTSRPHIHNLLVVSFSIVNFARRRRQKRTHYDMNVLCEFEHFFYFFSTKVHSISSTHRMCVANCTVCQCVVDRLFVVFSFFSSVNATPMAMQMKFIIE